MLERKRHTHSERERKRDLLPAWSTGTDCVCFHRGNGVGDFGGENKIHVRKTENKPFECVGTIEEVNFVINNLILRGYDKPYLLDYYKNNYKVEKQDDSVLTKLNDEHNVNDYLLNLLKDLL